MKGPYKQSPSTAMLTLKNNYAPQFSGLEIDIDRSKQNLQIKNIVIRSSNYPSLGRDEAIIKIEGHHWKLNTFRKILVVHFLSINVHLWLQSNVHIAFH